MKLKVQLDSPLGMGAQVWLDDTEISRGIRGLDISFSPGELNEVTLRLGIDSLEIDAPTLAILQAHVAATTPAAAEDDHPTFGEDPPPLKAVEATCIGATHRHYVKPEAPHA